MTDDLAAFERELRAAFADMVPLLVAKRRAYGPANLVRFGAIGIAIRASDKIDRLANLCRGGDAASADGETADDAWRDLVGYGVLGLLHHRGRLVAPGGGEEATPPVRARPLSVGDRAAMAPRERPWGK